MNIPKSYRYYKLSDLEAICEITSLTVSKLLTGVQPVEPSDILRLVLERNLEIPMLNEKAKSEFIVAPILSEMWYINQRFKPLSGLTFNIEASKGLKGICDFLISSKKNVSDLDSPVVCIFEAKDDHVERWYGQCGAEMYAARLFNAKKKNGIETIHGAVTNGITWQFLKLEGQVLYIDAQRYGTANLPQLLGALQKVYDFYKK